MQSHKVERHVSLYYNLYQWSRDRETLRETYTLKDLVYKVGDASANVRSGGGFTGNNKMKNRDVRLCGIASPP